MQDAAFRVLLGFLIFFGLAIGASFWLPGSLDPGAALHPDISSLLQSSGRAHSSVILIAFGMAMIIVTVMSIFVWVGFYKPAGGASLRKWSIVFFCGLLAHLCRFISDLRYIFRYRQRCVLGWLSRTHSLDDLWMLAVPWHIDRYIRAEI